MFVPMGLFVIFAAITTATLEYYPSGFQQEQQSCAVEYAASVISFVLL